MLRLYYRLIFLAILIPSFLYADGMIIGGDECSEGSASVSELCNGSLSFDQFLDTANADGWSWTTTKAVTIWGVEPYISYYGDATITCRIGTSANLTSYLAEGTSATITASGYKQVAFSGCVALSNSTTYYVGCIASSGSALALYDNDNDTCGNQAYSATSGWNMDTGPSAQDWEWRFVEIP